MTHALYSNAEAGEDIDGGVDSRLREARLVKMVEGLKRRLEQLKAENEELEELLRQADVNVKGKPQTLKSALISCSSAVMKTHRMVRRFPRRGPLVVSAYTYFHLIVFSACLRSSTLKPICRCAIYRPLLLAEMLR